MFYNKHRKKTQLINLAMMKKSHDSFISCLIANDVDITCIIDVGYCLIIQNKYVVRQEFIHLTDLGCYYRASTTQSVVSNTRISSSSDSNKLINTRTSRLQTELISEPVLLKTRGFCGWLKWFCPMLIDRN